MTRISYPRHLCHAILLHQNDVLGHTIHNRFLVTTMISSKVAIVKSPQF